MTTDTHPRRIFRVPLALTVRADLFVLADDLVEARRQAKLADASRYYDFRPDLIWIPDGEDTRRLKFTDVIVSVVDLSGITPTTAPANSHPDFMPQPKR